MYGSLGLKMHLSEFPCPIELWHMVARVSTAKQAAEMSSAPCPEV